MKMFQRWLGLGAVAAAVILNPLAAQESVPASTEAGATAKTYPRLKIGDVAPEFTVYGPDGKEVKLSDFRGKLVMLDIWATWCGPCVASMPHNSELAEKYAKEGFVILAVCASDSRENYDGWVKRNGDKYKFLTAHDKLGKDWNNSVFNTKYSVTGFPSIFLIGRDGKIAGVTAGGGPGENPHVTRMLAKGGLPIDISHLPPEKTDGPKSIPMIGKTPAMRATGAPASVPMVGMGGGGGGMSAATPVAASKFGSLEPGSHVPDFTVTSADGKSVKLSDFKGKTVIVNFFSNTERGPETYAVTAAAKYAKDDVVLFAVASAVEEAQFKQWVATAKPAYATGWDPSGKAWAENISHMNFGVGMYPAFAVVNKEGNLVGGYIGMGAQNVQRLSLMLLQAGVDVPKEDLPKMFPAATTTAMKGAAPAAAGGAMAPAQRVATLAPGAVAPDFVMHDVNGKEVKLSDFKNKIVILDFWATWCGPCIASFPHTQDIAKKYKDQDVIVLASGTSDTIAKFKEWIPKNSPKYPDMIWTFDPNERGSATFDERASQKHYKVVGIPTQFVIGRDGKIAATIVGNGGKEDARTETALASLGVKVDEAIVTKGKEQLAKSAEEEKARAIKAAADDKNPPPPFRENMANLIAGAPVPDVDLQNEAGELVKLSSYSKGKTVILGIWSAGMPPPPMVELWDKWNANYKDQNVVFLGVGAFGSREEFDKWRTANAGKYSFPLAFDPAGAPSRPAKPMDELTDEEKAAFRKAQSAHMQTVITAKLAGTVTMIPAYIAMNSEGKMLGWSAGFGPPTVNGIGNLLLRAGVKLKPEDMPARVYTAAETKPAAPEARVQTIKIGAMAPDFTTQTLEGKDVKISDFKGKVVILDFWATWCGPCMAAMPHTQEVAAQYKDQGVVTLGSCTSDTRAKFEDWVRRNQEKYPDMIWSHDKEERGDNRASRKLYGVSGIPTQFIIDREGKIVDIVVGYMKGEAILDGALAKAGIKVDPALVEKAKKDLAKRGN
ncbi:redoxin domain-containing protein [Oleiharenicola lentus]|uniref:redoxin domain-containing protein n=1 Tax=Oleiharenicola lentus TaxID=2508720 RepID=UPI003F67890F